MITLTDKTHSAAALPNFFQIIILTGGIASLTFGSSCKLPTCQNNNLERVTYGALFESACEGDFYNKCT